MVKVDWAGQMMWLVGHANEQDIPLGPRFSKKKRKNVQVNLIPIKYQHTTTFHSSKNAMTQG